MLIMDTTPSASYTHLHDPEISILLPQAAVTIRLDNFFGTFTMQIQLKRHLYRSPTIVIPVATCDLYMPMTRCCADPGTDVISGYHCMFYAVWYSFCFSCSLSCLLITRTPSVKKDHLRCPEYAAGNLDYPDPDHSSDR